MSKLRYWKPYFINLGYSKNATFNNNHYSCGLFGQMLINLKKMSPVCNIKLSTPIRSYSALPKRFYRKVNILQSDEKYEIILDQKKLKTPKGSVLKIENEALALAVATEWDAQKEVIQRSHMHLTALCSTVVDNPNNITKFDIVQQILSFLDTDTILFFSKGETELYTLQQREWEPHIDWFCQRYHVTLEPTSEIGPPQIPVETKSNLQKHLLSYNFAAIHGFLYAVEALKSVILTHTCVERRLRVDQAVLLSRLEEEFQCGHWGRVEWAHDLSQVDLQSRVAAAILFIHLNSASEHVTAKKKIVQ